MQIIETIAAMKASVREIKAQGGTIALVPTMGYLHEGHLALMRAGRDLADHLFISIFVNPTQFGPAEDLNKYPRDLERDTQLAASVGVESIFFPSPDEMYPSGYATYINVEGLTTGLCGTSRPTHFRGVATVVAKLFNIVEPDVAVFGQKDYQQLVVIERMVADLNMPVKIVAHPTVREEDGIAMSSRNKYLNPEERREALVLSRALKDVRKALAAGQREASVLKGLARALIDDAPLCSVDYVELVDAGTLAPVVRVEGRCVLALAVKIGATRLIDNILLEV